MRDSPRTGVPGVPRVKDRCHRGAAPSCLKWRAFRAESSGSPPASRWGRPRWRRLGTSPSVPLDKPLAVALQQAGVRDGASLRFIYRSPDSVTEPINLKAAGADLTEPARLALAESTPFPWAEAVSGVRRLKVHAKEGAWYLGVAERRCNTDLLDALASRNGFRIADRADRPRHAHRHRDAPLRRQRRSPLALPWSSWARRRPRSLTSHQGKVTSLRCVDSAMTRSSRRSCDSQSSRRDEELAFDAAVAVIAKIGLLPRGDLSAISNGAIDDSMKPLMRAAVQRLVVEVRQTIRFGLPRATPSPAASK
jgi:hypothetical protein